MIVIRDNSAEIRSKNQKYEVIILMPASEGCWASLPLYSYHTFYVEYPVALMYSRLCTRIGLFMHDLVLNIR
jgi:branched-subunit amino acid permease